MGESHGSGAMTVFVCLLRAIGPGTHKKMSMADLRQGCEEAGLMEVSTHVATGNVVLVSDRSAERVRKAVQAVVDHHGLGGMCDVFVRTRRQLAGVVKVNPFPDAAENHPQRVGVCFFQHRPRWPAWVHEYAGPERIAAIGNTLIIDYGGGISASKLMIERDTKARMTQRNWNTVVGLLRKAEALQDLNTGVRSSIGSR
jgi:uncharacterized protein (DUF1697 family)